MGLGANITIAGFGMLFIYVVVQILTYYGYSASSYANYITFYAFLLLCYFVLPSTIQPIGGKNELEA